MFKLNIYLEKILKALVYPQLADLEYVYERLLAGLTTKLYGYVK